MSTNLDNLQKIGFSRDEAAVYEYLLVNGALPAALLSRRLGITRTLIYKILNDLEAKNLIKKDESFKVTRFSASHPYELRKLAEIKKVAAEELAKNVETTLAPLVASFNLHSNKPAVHHMEGLVGVEQALEDTLTATEVICGYIDNDTINSEVIDISQNFNKKRRKLKIAKRTLMPDTPSAREYIRNHVDELSELRLLPNSATTSFHSVLNIYDKKVGYISYKGGVFMSTLIHDESIYAMQRFLFESLWQQAVRVPAPTQNTDTHLA